VNSALRLTMQLLQLLRQQQEFAKKLLHGRSIHDKWPLSVVSMANWTRVCNISTKHYQWFQTTTKRDCFSKLIVQSKALCKAIKIVCFIVVLIKQYQLRPWQQQQLNPSHTELHCMVFYILNALDHTYD
jgi:hypothetical protein